MYMIVGQMESYNRTQEMEGAFEADPVSEWTVPGGETGLEESMWQLSVGGGGQEPYPVRPEAADCMYYLRTGYCGYGARCRFNHPRDRGPALRDAARARGGEYPDRMGQPVCQYYMKTGMCKFGSTCKYHHPKQGGGFQSPEAFNIYGYPLRPGEKECTYYIKTGECKFGITCKFHHPQPAGAEMTAPVPGPIPAPSVYPTTQPPVQSSQPYGVVSGNWPVSTPTMLPGSYVPGTYGPMLLPTGMYSVPGWTSYPAPISPVTSASTQSTVGASPVYGLSQLYPSAQAYTGQYLSASPSVPSKSSHNEIAFPEKPGQVECQYYMRTGDCKFGDSCRYFHPPEWNSGKAIFVLSPMGLPLRPEAPNCLHYAQNGVCKFGPSCKFNHPMGGTLSYSPSASSLADMPVAPYPIGSSMGTLAPSSSSSNLHPELISVSNNKDSLSSRMPSVGNSSASVGSLSSKSTTVSHLSTLQSGSTTSTSGSSSSRLVHGSDV